jgi:deazaflavin-dependent oxidoreductase (nitroreductase family)
MLRADDEGAGCMDIPSADRALVELQKLATRMHRALLQSPLAPWLALLPGGRFLVLETVGRTSGQPRRTPLSYTTDGDAFVVIASNGGAPKHPDWYLNLEAHHDALVDVAGTRTAVRAETVTGPDRDRLWRGAVGSYGGYAGYQARTSREIPVVRLVPSESTS